MSKYFVWVYIIFPALRIVQCRNSHTPPQYMTVPNFRWHKQCFSHLVTNSAINFTFLWQSLFPCYPDTVQGNPFMQIPFQLSHNKMSPQFTPGQIPCFPHWWLSTKTCAAALYCHILANTDYWSWNRMQIWFL